MSLIGNAVNYLIGRSLPTAVSDNAANNTGAVRQAKYLEQFVSNIFPDFSAIGEEGSYFSAHNNQTGLATAAAPVNFSATNPFLAIYNGDNPANPTAKRIIMDYIAMINTVIGTAGANVQFALVLDKGNRGVTSGSQITAINNANPESNLKSNAIINAGNLTVNAATQSARTIVGNRYMKGAIPVVGDTHVVKFGGVDAPTLIGASGIVYSINNVPKIVIPPDWTLTLHLWLTSQSAASSYAPEVGWIER